VGTGVWGRACGDGRVGTGDSPVRIETAAPPVRAERTERARRKKKQLLGSFQRLKNGKNFKASHHAVRNPA